MKRNEINSGTGLSRYLFISLIIHGVIIFILAQAGIGTQSLTSQPRDYQEIRLVDSEEIETPSNTQEQNQDNKDQTKQGTKTSEKQAEANEKNKQPEPEPEPEPKQEPEQKSPSKVTTTEKTASKQKPEKTAQKAEAEPEKSAEEKPQESTQKSDEMITSEQGEEQVKVAEQDQQKQPAEDKQKSEEQMKTDQPEEETAQQEESASKAEDKPAETEQEQTTEESGEQGAAEEAKTSEEEPPPTPQSLVAKMVNPRYPKDASNEAVEGNVKLEVKVNKQGQMQNLQVVEAAGDERLNNIARLTIQHGWEFKSAVSDYKLTLLVKFKMIDRKQQVEVEYLDLSFVKE